MRSKTSYFNETVFWKNITHFWPVWLIYTILLLCMVPLRLLVNSGISYEGYSAQEIKEIKMNNFMQILFSDGSGALIALLSLAIGIIVAMAVFYYLYNNRSSHLFHSLPLKRTELFISNFLSGICMLVVPVLLAFILGTVCCIMQGITSLQYLLAWALMLTGESFFFYSMAIFVGMFSGQLLAMPVFTIILNVLYIGCRYVITCMISTIGYGMANSYADRMNSILSPVIYLSNKVGVEYDYLEDRIEYHMFGLSVVGIYVLVGVVLIVISCLLYQKRKLEDHGRCAYNSGNPPGVPLGNGFLCGFSYCNSAERTVWRAGTYITGQFPDGFIYNIDCRLSGIFRCGNDFDEETACSDQKEIVRMRRHVRNFRRISSLYQMECVRTGK